MCGIVGQWNRNDNVDRDLFNRMRDTLVHRGPDGYGSYFSDDGKVALGHRRLAFLDLSYNAKQPFCNEDSSVWTTVNGEIYNYLQLRKDLERNGHIFKSNCDSEVIIHAYEEWGIDMVSRLEGMFAFAIWDATKRKMFIARDKFGIKPLFYYCDSNMLIFASEIKAIVENPAVQRKINYRSMCEFFYYRYVPSPNTIFEGIHKVEPAHYLEFSDTDKCTDNEYYKFQTAENEMHQNQLVLEIDALLSQSVKMHIQSDVPICSFLSGGYDSSLLVKYFSDNEKGFNTYSIGFDGWLKSEHQYAEQVSKIFGTNHRSMILDDLSLDVLKDLMYYYDDPIADISIIPTYLISKEAAKYNKAVLSGEGADELFAGYTWHKKYLWTIPKMQEIMYKLKGWDLPMNRFDIDSYAKVTEMGKFDGDALTELLPKDLHGYIPEDKDSFFRKYFDESIPTPKRFQMLDIKCFMAELVLTKIDRASMANSLEVRVPFLNTGIFEKMLSLSPDVYFNPKKQKVVIQKILKKYLPREILARKKQGFVGPDTYYMNYEWYRKSLDDSRLVNDGIIRREAIDKYFAAKEHWRLWKIAVFEMWYRQWMVNN